MWGAAPRRRLILAFAAALALLALVSPGAAAVDTQAPAPPSNLRVTATTPASITLAWDASTDNVAVTGYNLYLWSTKVGTTTSTSYTFTGLKCGTTYRLRVAAFDAAGNVSGWTRPTRVDAATSACPTGDTQPPTAPANLHVTAANGTSVSLAWNASTDNLGVTGYDVYNGPTRAGGTSSTSFTVTGLACGTAYTFAVDAYDAAGNDSSQTPLTTSTAACPTSPPPSGSPFVGDNTVEWGVDYSPSGEVYASRTSATVSGQINELVLYVDSPNTATTIKLGLYSNLNGQPANLLATGTVSSIKNGAWNAVGISPVTLTAGTTYWVALLGTGGTIRYRNHCCGSGDPVSTVLGSQTSMPSTWVTGTYTGNDGPLAEYGDWTSTPPSSGSGGPTGPSSGPSSPDSTAPSSPSTLLPGTPTTTSLPLSWQPATDDVGVVGYDLYVNGAAVGTATGTSYTFTGLSCGTAYTLGVDAYDAAGNHSTPALLTASTSPCSATDTTAPSAPTALTVSGATTNSLTLKWSPSTDNIAVTGYDAYRNGANAGTTTGTSYTLSGLACGNSYTLGADAFDAAGNHSSIASMTASTSACSTPNPQLYVSPSGSDANSCTQAAPCLSFNRAYQAAQPGQTVQVAGGSYGAQLIALQSSKTSAGSYVTFQPAAGASVTINGDLENHAAWIKIQGIKVTGDMLLAEGGEGAHNIVFDQMDSTNFVIGPGHDVTLSNSDVGPSNGCGYGLEDKIGPDPGVSSTATPYNINVVGNLIHDQNGDPSGGCHFGGLFLISGHDLVFAQNEFVRNVVYDFYISPFASDAYGGVNHLTIENNMFAGPVEWIPQQTTWDGQPNLQITCHGAPTPTNCNDHDWLVRYNSFYRTALHFFDTSNCRTNCRFVGNIGGWPGSSDCAQGSYSYNVWVGGTCSTTDRTVSALPYVSTSLGSPDFHLTGGVAQDLIALTSGDYAIGSDIDGQSRPIGPARDAGADER